MLYTFIYALYDVIKSGFATAHPINDIKVYMFKGNSLKFFKGVFRLKNYKLIMYLRWGLLALFTILITVSAYLPHSQGWRQGTVNPCFVPIWRIGELVSDIYHWQLCKQNLCRYDDIVSYNASTCNCIQKKFLRIAMSIWSYTGVICKNWSEDFCLRS